MSKVFLGLSKTFKRKGSFKVFFISLFLLILGYFAFVNLQYSLSYFSYSSLSFFTQIKLFLITFFDITQLETLNMFFLVSVGAVLGALVITLLIVYGKIRKEAVTKDEILGGVALFLTILGVGCSACGAILLNTILGFVGISSLLTYFPYHGVEIGYLGLILLLYLIYSLSIRIANPYTC